MWVIKLGGSVAYHPSLVQWLMLVARWADGRVILVPGGGIFADAVRDFQKIREKLPDGHLSDQKAHALAIYAMDQMARSFVSIVPELVLVRNPLEIAERCWQHRGLVWLPSEMVLNTSLYVDSGLPENWSVTSDSLAAWLAKQVDASHLLLVKSDDSILDDSSYQSLEQLQAAGIVDNMLAEILHEAKFQTWVLHQTRYERFKNGFDAQSLGGLVL